MRRCAEFHFWARVLIFLSGILRSAHSPAADDRNLPTLGDLQNGAAQFESRIQNLSVKLLSIEKCYQRNPTGNRGRIPIQNDELIDQTDNIIANWDADSTGANWHKESIRRVVTRPGESRTEGQSSLQSVFDGQRCILKYYFPGGSGLFGFSNTTRLAEDRTLVIPYVSNEVAYGISPLNFTVRHAIHGAADQLGVPISQFISAKDAEIAGRDTWEDTEVFLVDVPDTKSIRNRKYKEQLWICPGRDFVTVKRRTYVRDLDDPMWQLERELESIGLNQLQPQVWLPSQVKFQMYGAANAQSRELNELFKSKVIRCTEWKINQELPANSFQIERVIEDKKFREGLLNSFNLSK